MKQQIILIHGGESWKTHEEYIDYLKKSPVDLESLRLERKGWKDNLAEHLGADFDVIFPEMPCWMNSKYAEWKIWFEKIAALIDDGAILVGHSLGGIFLAEYFAETNFTKKVKAIFLIAAPYASVASNKEMGDFMLPNDISKIQEQCPRVFIYQSKDDPVVPFADALHYAAALPKAKLIAFEQNGHFRQAEFPELVQQIKELVK